MQKMGEIRYTRKFEVYVGVSVCLLWHRSSQMNQQI